MSRGSGGSGGGGMRLADIVTAEEFKEELYRSTTEEDVISANMRMEEMAPYADVIIGLVGPHGGSVMMTLQIIDNILRRKVIQ